MENTKLEINSLCSVNFEEFTVFQVQQNQDEEKILDLQKDINVTVKTLKILVDPKREAAKIMSNLVGNVPVGLMKQVDFIGSSESYPEKQSFVIVRKGTQEDCLRLAEELGLEMLEVTESEVHEMIEVTSTSSVH